MLTARLNDTVRDMVCPLSERFQPSCICVSVVASYDDSMFFSSFSLFIDNYGIHLIIASAYSTSYIQIPSVFFLMGHSANLEHIELTIF